MNHGSPQDRLDRATSRRLARLAGRPINTARLERRMEAVLREATRADATTDATRFIAAAWARWWRPAASAAAAILIALTIGWFALNGGTSAALAAPAALARIHHDVAAGLAPHLKVSSVEEANQLLADQASGVVAIPELPGVMLSCCLHQHGSATLTCALIEQDGRLITVAVADGARLHSPRGQTFRRAGRDYIAHTANGINMVMTHDDGRWLCVMGETTSDVLLDVAVQIRF